MISKGRDTRIIQTEYGPILVSNFLYDLWQKYGWPNEETLKSMAETYARYGLPDGIDGQGL